MTAGTFLQLDRWEDACERIQEARDAGWALPEEAVGEAIRACGRGGAWRNAVSLLEEHTAATATPAAAAPSAATPAADATTAQPSLAPAASASAAASAGANAGPLRALAMRACVSSGEWRHALRIFDVSRRAGAAPLVSEWRAALAAFARGGLWQRAVGALHSMRRAGVPPEPQDVSSAARACAKAADWRALGLVLSIASTRAAEAAAAAAAAEAAGGARGAESAGRGSVAPPLPAAASGALAACGSASDVHAVLSTVLQVRRDRGLLMISASFTYDAGHSSAARGRSAGC